MLIDETLVRPASLSVNRHHPHKTTQTIEAHAPHCTGFATEKDSYADILRLMQEHRTDKVCFFKDGFSVGDIHKEDLIARLIDMADKYETDLESMAHDLKHPITSIQAINYLLTDTPEGSDKQKLLSKSNEACKYATSLLNDFLLSQQLDNYNINPKETDLNEVIRECLPMYKSMLYKKDQFLLEQLSKEPMICTVDRLKFHRVIDNLIVNAIKFTPEGGEITVVSRKTGDAIEVDVSDTGIGISADDQERLFERFTKARRPGTQGEHSTGLGLFITRQIVEAHQGSISIRSTVGKGTTFCVRIPC